MNNLFHNNFKYDEIEFVNFIHLNESELIEILSWRNDENTRKWMKNTDFIPISQHLDYCKNLTLRNDIAQWKVKYLDRSIGVISINKFYEENKSCEWGFYMSKNSYPEDILLLYYHAQKHFFTHLNILKLNGSVKIENQSAMLFNSFFNFLEIEKININNIIYSIRELKKSNWILNKRNRKSLIRDFSTYYRKYKIENNV
jgi:RimJ/RimL family protein N-acetyltransferase